MKLKRLIAMALTCAMLCSMLIAAPATAAEQKVSAFNDITDTATAEAAEVLRLLGIVSGTGDGRFNPGRTLTRAEFCKMAVLLLGKGEEAAAQMNRTIFDDVKGSYWARGFINLASSTSVGSSTGSDGKPTGGNMLMMGKGDGKFYPENAISYAEAVTVLMRVLGYSDKDVTNGSTWFSGYLASAKAIGLSDGVNLEYWSAITRGQTALLFENLLFIKSKGAEEIYLTKLGGQVGKEVILLDMDATTDDNTTGAIKATNGTETLTYKTDHVPFATTLAGHRAKLVLDKDEKVIAVTLNTNMTSRTVTVVRAEATYLTVSSGEKMEVANDTSVYKDGVKKTYNDIYLNLKAGAQVTFHYGATGKIEYLFIPNTDVAETAAVAKTTSGTPFAGLVGNDTGYRVLKNGVAASLSDVRQYDVATYDKATKTLSISDLRLTGVYENVSPSPATPLRVTILGATFPVLSSAYDDLTSFKIGDTITLLLTVDGQVAGAVSASAAKSTTVGTVLSVDENSGEAKVQPLFDLKDADGKAVTLGGKSSLRGTSATKMQGQLVTVSSSKVDQINLSRLSGSGTKSGTLDVAKRTLGDTALADNVHIYERVGNGAPVEIKISQLTRATVPASKVAYAGVDYAGKINTLVLDDATGDQYTYGMAETGTKGTYDKDDPMSYSNPTVGVKNSDADPNMLVGGSGIKNGDIIGITASLDKIDGTYKLANFVTLKAIANVPRSAFQITADSIVTGSEGSKTVSPVPIGTVTTTDMVLPIAGNVVCYNQTTKKWFSSLDEARAYSDSLTIYYDRNPNEGGKVRLVVVQ